jgi:DNA-binding transcriptional LysR family regulator
MDRLLSMRVFLKVVDEGTFAAATRRMDLDPAIVTRLVADLERHLETPLLQRTTRRLALTPAGEDYTGRLRAILAEVDEAETSVRSQASKLQGTLRLLASASLATHVLAPALPEFVARYPGIRVDIRSLDAGEPALEDHDLTFVTASVPLPSDIVTRQLAVGAMRLYASPEYLARNGCPRTPADLATHRILRQRLPGQSLDRIRLFDPDDEQREVVVEAEPCLVTDFSDPLLRATLEGLGISSQAQALAAPHVSSGALRPLLAPWITDRVSLSAAYASRKFLSARARVFLDYIVDAIQGSVARAEQVVFQGQAPCP